MRFGTLTKRLVRSRHGGPMRERGIYERAKGTGIWWIRYSDSTGKERREKAGTRAAARQLYSKRKQEALEGRKLPENLRAVLVPFSELLDDASEHISQANRPRRYGCRLSLIKSALGGVAASAITPQDIRRWLFSTMKRENWKPATANRYKALLSLAFRLGIENGKCSNNPARAVRRLSENNERIRFLSPDEEVELRRVIRERCPKRIHEFEIALHTGMRQGEQYGHRWDDVDLERRQVTLKKTKNGSTRYVPLNTSALRAFQRLKRRSHRESIFLNSRRDAPLQAPRFWWDDVLSHSNVSDFRWHDLRHTFASRCVMAGVDLRTLQQLLGHRTLQMVVRYTHLSSDHQLAAVERLCKASVLKPVLDHSQRPPGRTGRGEKP